MESDEVFPVIANTLLVILLLVAGVNDPLTTLVTNNELPPLLK